MLSSLRVLDLTDERGAFAGHLLASLGAEVITVEAEPGTPARRMPPFAGDGASLYWQAYGRGKRSVVLDLASPADREAFHRLVATADMLVDSSEPGALSGVGAGHPELAAVNPTLIHVSISPFGQDGPRAGWASTDLTLAAASGQLGLSGDADRAPLRVGVPQAHLQACLEAVGAALIALYERHLSGCGQHVDVSVQEAFMLASQYQMLGHGLNGTSARRAGGGARVGPITLRFIYPCRDGHVAIAFAFGAVLGRFARNLMTWLWEEGHCDEATRDKDWVGYGMLLHSGEEPLEEWERVKGLVAGFLTTKTKAELLEAAMSRRLVLSPVSTLADVIDSPQFRARGVFQPDGDGLLPGRFARFGAVPARPLPPAPRLGEHTAEVLAGLDRLAPPAPEADAPTAPRAGAALEGLKVLDFMWVMAGPAGSRVLADYGATVIRVESANRPDTIRTLGPFRDDEADPEFSGPWNNANAGKLGLALDLSKPASREVIEDLVRWADVVLESFSPGAMARMGFAYEDLRAINPDVIMVSSSLVGQDGPLAGLAGYGNMAAALAGFTNITGWPDRDPTGPFSAYTDTTAPRFLTIAVMAALEHRRRTGDGQYVDLAQCESAVQLLAPALLDYQLNGHLLERMGNDDAVCSPHGVFPCQGEDRWVAVAVRHQDDWAALAGLLARPDLRDLPLSERRARSSELARLVAGWTAGQDPEAAAAALQRAGVPAHAVLGTAECWADPHLQHRGYFVEVAHETQPGGTTWVEGSRFKLSRTPASIRTGGPTYGQHASEILTGILGYDDEKVAELAMAEILE